MINNYRCVRELVNLFDDPRRHFQDEMINNYRCVRELVNLFDDPRKCIPTDFYN